jgi:hypothetical protein
MKLKFNAAWLGSVVALTYLTGCGGSNSGYKTADQLRKEQPAAAAGDHGDHDHAGHDHEHDHAHAATHGGTMLEVGEHVAQLELVLDPATGEVTAYVLDAHAENPQSLEQPELAVTITPEAAEGQASPPAAVVLQLKPAPTADADAQKTSGNSVFAGQSDELKGVDHYDFAIDSVEVGGKKYEKLEGHAHPAEHAEPEKPAEPAQK